MIGTYITYYFHCKRQLWLFSRDICMEHNSEDVSIGKILSENSYPRMRHEIHISNLASEVVIDFLDRKNKIVHEVKKSNKMEELHIWQLKFYLYFLESLGLANLKGKIDYPKLKRTIEVELKKEDKEVLEKTMKEINQVISQNSPPALINKPYCKKCSYYEFCCC